MYDSNLPAKKFINMTDLARKFWKKIEKKNRRQLLKNLCKF